MTAPPSPDRAAVRERLLDLLAGRESREGVAAWASTWVTQDDPDVEDPIVWNALRELSGADLMISPADYLHGEDDLHQWLDRLEGDEDL